MADPEVVVRHLVERLVRGQSAGSPDTLHGVVAAKLGDSALTQLETAVARLRLALREAMDNDPKFAADLRAALAREWWVPGPGGGFGPGGAGGRPFGPGGSGGMGAGTPGGTGGNWGYAVEDVWVDEKDQDPPEPGESSPRT